MVKSNARAQAVVILQRTLYHQQSLVELRSIIKAQSEAAFIQSLCYGVLRYYWQLAEITQRLIKKIPKEKEVYLLILVGLFDLIYMQTPSYAAVSEAVIATKYLKKVYAKNLVNAVLRNFDRNRETLIAKANETEESLVNHPQWLIDLIKQSWPHFWQAILQANNEQAPMSLRINQQKITRDDYLQLLEKENILGTKDLCSLQGIILIKAQEVQALPGFDKGYFFVQDGAAQLAANLLPAKKEMKVLDACAAPGGKTSHLLECEPTLQLTAIDCNKERVERIYENLKRLQLTAKIITADILNIESWWGGGQYDRILIDAPCSSTGVIRRHPDIKHLRKPGDIKELAKTQLLILKKLWPLLKVEGLLLYATCSILPEENYKVIEEFLAKEQSAKEILIQATWGHACSVGRQILPGESNMDGFYYCLLQKIASK
ncbi:MAG: 16S rRNA (cytosine(967)-C(5))-methyltransferase [Gammaproteobacteria bacterium RIFCSPHIGHO2_12_FULL_35_23]|nr:MAG: 16S rRNA (cytosine(967)-C(5))-methyltransferase [Gammaproteobacteria bacterium RIFCSPHIGHO2_12_FULL_35_23]